MIKNCIVQSIFDRWVAWFKLRDGGTTIHVVFDTNDVRFSDRIPFWKDTICHHLIGVRCQGASSSGFEGRVSVLGGQDGALAQIAAGPHVAWTDDNVPREKDFFYLFVQSRGDVHIRRNEGDFTLRPGDLYLHDAKTDHQFEFPDSFEHLALRVPSGFARRHWPEFRNLNFMLYEGNKQPANRLVTTLAAALIEAADQLNEQEVSTSVIAAFNIFVSSVNARQPEHFNAIPSPVLLLQRAKHYIAAHLQDVDLSAQRVAQMHGITRRYLDTLFAQEGTTATTHIQDLRLSRCAAELERHRATSVPVSEIAYDWGFRDPSSFARAFRRKHGCSPSAYRKGYCFQN